MAKIKQGILGGFSGSVANVVGSSWKGLAVMKAKPLSVANPKTAAQTAQRTAFKSAGQLASDIKNTICKPFWDRFAQQMSGYNAWMQENVKHYDQNGAPTLTELVMSKGNIGALSIEGAEYGNSPDTFDIHWNTAELPANSIGTDQVAIVVVNEDNELVGELPVGSVIVSDGSAQFVKKQNTDTGLEMYCYVVTRRPDGTIVSETARNIVTQV